VFRGYWTGRSWDAGEEEEGQRQEDQSIRMQMRFCPYRGTWEKYMYSETSFDAAGGQGG
jgi:hypothetical protein